MHIDKQRQLFFGYKIDSKLRDALANATPATRNYFEDPESPFLRICTVGDEKWIGKVVNAGLGAQQVDDILRNVISILRRIAPNVRHTPSNVKIFSLGDGMVDLRVESGEILASKPDDDEAPYLD
jgi:hypothetical protein